METLLFKRNFEPSMVAPAPNDLSNSDCQLSVFNLRHIEELLLIPTRGKLFDSQRHCVEKLNTVFNDMFVYDSFPFKNNIHVCFSALSYARVAQDLRLCFELITHCIGRVSK